MIIGLIVPERPKRGRAALDVPHGLAEIYLKLDEWGCESARKHIASGDDTLVAVGCTIIAEGVVRSYLGGNIDRGQAVTEYLRLGLDVKTIPWPVAIALGRQNRGH